MLAGLVAAAVLLAVLLAAPYRLSKTGIEPTAGIALGLSALLLRAAIVIVAAAILLLALPSTPQFGAISSWCLHTALPYVSTHIGVNGHAVGHAAALTPASLILLAASSALLGAWRASREVRLWLRSSSIGSGPAGSLIVGGSRIVLATAGIRHPRVLVSAGALIALDDGELRAGLEHERGHLARGHRIISTVAVALYGFARPLPGSRAALEFLHFHLERDADEYSVRRTGDAASLASAIAKAASTPHAAPAALGLGSSDTVDRIRVLEDDASTARGATLAGALLSAMSILATAAVLLSVPLVVAATTLDAAFPFANVFGC